MTTLVIRKSVDDERVGGPFTCSDRNEMARVLGRLTLEERVAYLLTAQETALELVDGQRKILCDGQVVGYVVVLSTE
jgi:hypothetical protein